MRIAKDLHLWCAFHLSKTAIKFADQRLQGVPCTSPYCRGDPSRTGKAARLFCCFLWRHHALKAPLSPLPSLWGYFSDAFDHGGMLPRGCCFKRIQDAPRQLAGGDRLPQGSSLLLRAPHPLMALRLLQAAAHSLGVFSRAGEAAGSGSRGYWRWAEGGAGGEQRPGTPIRQILAAVSPRSVSSMPSCFNIGLVPSLRSIIIYLFPR